MGSDAAFAVFAMDPKSTSSDSAYAEPSVNLQLGRYYPQLLYYIQHCGRGICILRRPLGLRDGIVHGAPHDCTPSSTALSCRKRRGQISSEHWDVKVAHANKRKSEYGPNLLDSYYGIFSLRYYSIFILTCLMPAT